MSRYTLSLGLRLTAATLPFVLASAVAVAQTSNYSVIANLGIHPGEGAAPYWGVVFDHAGNLFGSTSTNLLDGSGTMFELIPEADGNWTEKTLGHYSPTSAMLVDADGNLYGTRAEGTGGSVFELSHSGDGSWTKTDLYRTPSEGDVQTGFPPAYGVIFDKEGNLYDTTLNSGVHNAGTIFKLSRQQDGSWTTTVLYDFKFSHNASSGLTMDEAGNLYGTQYFGGTMGHLNYAGAVFRLRKPETEGGSWTYTNVHTFPGPDNDGNSPTGDAAGSLSQLILDNKGNLYGTSTGGGAYNKGTVFEVPSGARGNSPDKILYSFGSSSSGAEYPMGGVVFDKSGNLYGTASGGGEFGGGKIFELLPQSDGLWTERALHDFGGETYRGVHGADGFNPLAGLTIGPDGNLYGTTFSGGYHPGEPEEGDTKGYGTVFKLVVH